MTTTSELLEMGQDLSILSDELREGSQALANLQADIEDISMFGKDKNNTTYADININKLKEFSSLMDDRINALKELQVKIEEMLKSTKASLDSYNQHVYSK